MSTKFIALHSTKASLGGSGLCCQGFDKWSVWQWRLRSKMIRNPKDDRLSRVNTFDQEWISMIFSCYGESKNLVISSYLESPTFSYAYLVITTVNNLFSETPNFCNIACDSKYFSEHFQISGVPHIEQCDTPLYGCQECTS